MAQTSGAPQELLDFIFDFALGMDSGRSPIILPKNQCAFITNGTVRGTFVQPRPPYWKYKLSFESDATRTGFLKGLFQEAQYYQPDSGAEYFVVAITGRIYKVLPNITARTAFVSDITGGNPQDSVIPQHFMWQAEKWIIWNDSIHNPVFWNGSSTSRSTGNVPPPGPGAIPNIISNFWTVPAAGGTITLTMTAPYPGLVGDLIVIVSQGLFQIVTIGVPGPNDINVKAINPTYPNSQVSTAVPPGFPVTYYNTAPTAPFFAQLPPGKMGTYGMGRNWMCLPDGKRFLASDIVGASSGSMTYDFRDSVLFVTENAYLVGGGFFTVPGSIGDIQAMTFSATLDASLGQGALQVATSSHVFSCNAPVDRLTWQTLTNPILTESLIANGALNQNATILWNGDIIFRARDGIRSLILARREFATWGNVPQSNEVNERVLAKDVQSLLNFGSAIIFDNRFLITVSPTQHAQGVYHPGLIALNADPISSIRGKEPAVYDGLWNGLNVLKLLTGDFAKVQHAFAFSLNTTLNEIELWELLPSATTEINDSGTNPITWSFETPVLDFGQKDPRKRQYLQLNNGEVGIDELQSTVNFLAQYKPDQYPCWTDWFTWQECADMSDPNSQVQFRPRMGLGTPSSAPCDNSTGRPMRNGYSYQLKFTITGKCRFLLGRFEAIIIPQPKFAPQVCP